jgi:MoaA/NifB/PqqE/SkfB family radical SAM enzyme
MTLRDFVSKQHLLYTTRNNPPDAVEIETTTICNRKCVYCPNSKISRPQTSMDKATFKKIIDSLAEIGFSGRISPHFYGEPLMDERLPELIKYTRGKLPKAHIKLFSNGDLLTVEKYKELCDTGINVFRVSQHSLMPSNIIKETLKYAEENKGAKIEYLNYYSEYFEYKNKNNILMNRGGLINIQARHKSTCFFVNQLTFDYAGNAVLCCNDYLSSVRFGNIKTSSVKDIWYDINYVKARRNIINGKWVFEICKKCSNEFGVLPLEADQKTDIRIST